MRKLRLRQPAKLNPFHPSLWQRCNTLGKGHVHRRELVRAHVGEKSCMVWV